MKPIEPEIAVRWRRFTWRYLPTGFRQTLVPRSWV